MFFRFLLRRDDMPDHSRYGDGFAANPRMTNQATDSNQTITVSAIMGGLYYRSGTNTNRTDTTATAVDLLAAMPAMNINDSIMLVFGNHTANAYTIAGGTGVTVAGNTSVAATSRTIGILQKTSATTMTLTLF